MLNTLIGKAKFGGVGGTGGIKYFKFVLLGGDGRSTNYNGVGGRGGGGLLEYIISSDTMTSEVVLEARTVGGGQAGLNGNAKGGNGYYLTTSVGLPSGPGPGTWVGGPDSTPLKPTVIAAVGGGGGEGRADNLSNIQNNVVPQIPWSNFTGPIGGGHGFGSGASGKPGRGFGPPPSGLGAGGGASTGSGGSGSAPPATGDGSPPSDTGSNGAFLRAGRGVHPTNPYSGGNHGGGGGGGYYGGGAGGSAPGPNDAHYGGGGGGGSGFADTSYPNYYSQVSVLGGKSKYIDLSFPGTPAGSGGGVYLTSAPLEQINANTVTYTEVFSGADTKQITLKLDGTFTID